PKKTAEIRGDEAHRAGAAGDARGRPPPRAVVQYRQAPLRALLGTIGELDDPAAARACDDAARGGRPVPPDAQRFAVLDLHRRREDGPGDAARLCDSGVEVHRAEEDAGWLA